MMDFYTVSSETIKELEHPRFFYNIAVFGPVDSYVRDIINQKYVASGRKVPDGYLYEYERE